MRALIVSAVLFVIIGLALIARPGLATGGTVPPAPALQVWVYPYWDLNQDGQPGARDTRGNIGSYLVVEHAASGDITTTYKFKGNWPEGIDLPPGDWSIHIPLIISRQTTTQTVALDIHVDPLPESGVLPHLPWWVNTYILRDSKMFLPLIAR